MALSRENARYGYRRIWALLRREGWVHVWSYHFVMEVTEDGRKLKLMPIVDEYTRECLALPTECSLTAKQVGQTLAHLFAERGAPERLRSDNGPEFITEAVREWLENSGVETLYIELGSPWENAYSETFVSRLRDELLDREVFANVAEAKVLTGNYRDHYNHHRPHGALGYLTPTMTGTSNGIRSLAAGGDQKPSLQPRVHRNQRPAGGSNDGGDPQAQSLVYRDDFPR